MNKVGMGVDPKRLQAAFEQQNREIRKMGEAFNTMRLFAMMLVTLIDPETKCVNLSAKELNEMSDRMKHLSLNVENRALTDHVFLQVVDNEEETTMSVDTDNKEAPLIENAPPPPPPEPEAPKMCECTHTNHDHIAGHGVCKKFCGCTSFKEKELKPLIVQ